MVKKIATIGAAAALLAASAGLALAVPPEAPAPGCPSAFTGDQVVPSDSGVTPPPNNPNDPSSNFAPRPINPKPDLVVMFSGVCVTPAQ